MDAASDNQVLSMILSASPLLNNSKQLVRWLNLTGPLKFGALEELKAPKIRLNKLTLKKQDGS
jgi:hypothetical protein